MLAELGFTGVTFFPDAPNRVERADQDALRGHVLTNGIDANGRVIGFVYRGEASAADGAEVFLAEPEVDQSANTTLLKAGLVYPAFYATLPETLRMHLSVVSRDARAAADPTGIWPRSTADPDGPAHVADLAALQELVMWPKLFRRLVAYLGDSASGSAGAADLDGFDDWLRADPVHRDDAVFLLGPQRSVRLHEVIEAAGQRVQLTVWPDEFVIEPDPAPVEARR